ncbi:uncharacterized protein LOC115883059 [Sitophilus oryzae]|uniref:Uncharacterized protein LOC115883059 n=1 Tax=Sitophilus oryzae TaxID=7048 RepID=A0A6J2Y2H9_SITOR|nr:uncharacterized protein LOC115883059 [Sitophilus oryzae]
MRSIIVLFVALALVSVQVSADTNGWFGPIISNLLPSPESDTPELSDNFPIFNEQKSEDEDYASATDFPVEELTTEEIDATTAVAEEEDGEIGQNNPTEAEEEVSTEEAVEAEEEVIDSEAVCQECFEKILNLIYSIQKSL